MSIQFYNDELAHMTGGKIIHDSLDYDPKMYKTCEAAG